VPPAKKVQKASEHTPIPPSNRATTEATERPVILPTTKDASLNYSRYTPPSKTRVVALPVADPSRNESEQLSLVDGSKRKHEVIEGGESVPTTSKKQKKQKEKSATIRQKLPSSSYDRSASIDESLDDTNNDVKVKNMWSKSKRKANGNVTEDAKEDDEEEDMRHSRLLEKRDKSLRKAEKLAKKVATEPMLEEASIEEPLELHDLVPLPQPEPIPEPAPQSLLTSLPSWLGNPIRVLPTATASFRSVGVSQKVEESLQKKGFKHAFAVQAALLPYLLPGKSHQDGDFLVSAATGSGKTLSYVLPMVENISHNQVTKLRGLIVLPTRELVSQAKDVSEICAAIYSSTRRLKIGTAVGNETFKVEQSSLMEQELVYNPIKYREQVKRLNKKWEGSESGSDKDLCDEEILSDLVDHVNNSISKIDILICTPGRLVEHLKSTPGFDLKDVQWLVVDEADKLLDQSFQEWLDIVMVSLQKPRKIILSATITRDVGKLNGLKLARPQLVVVEEQQDVQSDALFLPATLRENAVKVEEEGVKPLYLMEILQRAGLTKAVHHVSSDSSDGSTSSSSSSDDSSKEDEQARSIQSVTKQSQHGALIFTKSNESAVRLSRLIALLKPDLADNIGILTSTTRSSDRKTAIRSFEAGKLSLLVASDLVSRGLDLANLANVINYDIPTSLTSYVHRVGRTARAGKDGYAWTLHTSTEARWFWNEIGKAEGVKRGMKVERVKVNTGTFDRDAYENALGTLEKETTER